MNRKKKGGNFCRVLPLTVSFRRPIERQPTSWRPLSRLPRFRPEELKYETCDPLLPLQPNVPLTVQHFPIFFKKIKSTELLDSSIDGVDAAVIFGRLGTKAARISFKKVSPVSPFIFLDNGSKFQKRKGHQVPPAVQRWR